MLTYVERYQAIDILTNSDANSINGNYYEISQMIKYGFKGYAGFSDQELLRQINKIAKSRNDYSAQHFLTSIAADKFLLE